MYGVGMSNRQVVGYYKKDGKTRPITKRKGKNRYSGQTKDSSWKESSIEYLKSKPEKPIVYGGTPVEYEEVKEGYGTVKIKNGNGPTLRTLWRTEDGDLVDEHGKTVATREQLVTMRRHMRYSQQKIYPGTREGQLMREGTGFASAIITGGMSVIITPDTLYEIRNIMETEGFKESSKTIGAMAPAMMA
jgi:hypothetical protein